MQTRENDLIVLGPTIDVEWVGPVLVDCARQHVFVAISSREAEVLLTRREETFAEVPCHGEPVVYRKPRVEVGAVRVADAAQNLLVGREGEHIGSAEQTDKGTL